MRRDIEEGGFDDFALLGSRDLSGGTTKQPRFPELDLDKADCVAVTHEQIDFAEAAAVVGMQQNQAMYLQVVAGLIFETQSFAQIFTH